MAGDRRHAGVFCMGERFNVVTGLAVQPRPDHSLRGILGSVGTEHCPSPPTLMPPDPMLRHCRHQTWFPDSHRSAEDSVVAPVGAA